MGLDSVVSLTEAAAFTFGCVVLRASRLDPKQVEIVLSVVAAVLAATVLIALIPGNIATDPQVLDPAGVWPQPS